MERLSPMRRRKSKFRRMAATTSGRVHETGMRNGLASAWTARARRTSSFPPQGGSALWLTGHRFLRILGSAVRPGAGIWQATSLFGKARCGSLSTILPASTGAATRSASRRTAATSPSRRGRWRLPSFLRMIPMSMMLSFAAEALPDAVRRLLRRATAFRLCFSRIVAC